RKRNLATRYFLPGVILAGFATLLAWSLRDSLVPAQPVTVVPVVSTRGEVQQSGATLFQAAGWGEPRPTPVLVAGLADGVVSELPGVEGQEVKAGEPVAKLIDDDAKLLVNAAEADCKLREAEARTLVAKAEQDLKFLPFQMQAAESRQKLAKSDLDS